MENEEIKEESEEETEEIEETSEDSETDWKALALKNQGIVKRLKTKLEKIKPEEKPEPEAPKEQEIKPKDLYALMKANVHEEDLQEVTEFARFRGISVAEALKSNVIKTLLADKEEERKVAEATNVSSSRKAPRGVSVEDIVSKAEKGEMPSEDNIDKLVAARLDGKKNK